ncbi:MAG: agmatine deiminase [Actinobacteria bacterium]|nr:agmatine deiminase [Actinomycetota bacterium]
MPADWEPHERTLIAWPTRADAWRGTGLDAAKACHTAVVDAVSQFEPVTVVANPEDVEEAQKLCPGNNVEVVGIPIDDSWLRDSGPIIVTGAEGERVGVDFDFNGWGDRFTPYENDRKVSTEILKLLGIERHASSLVLEGGSIVVDGSGLLATTEQCLLNENRNLDTPRGDLERALQELLGIDDVIWLDQGLAEDADTDGHVDNICAFLAPGRALLQTAPPGDPNHEPMVRNRERLEAAGVEVETLELLPRAARSGSEDVVIPYLNFYMANGGAVVPTAGVDPDMDEEALGFLRSLMPGREVIGVPALTLAFGGGGIHCITQQVPVA